LILRLISLIASTVAIRLCFHIIMFLILIILLSTIMGADETLFYVIISQSIPSSSKI